MGELILRGQTWFARWYDGEGKRKQESTKTDNKVKARRFLSEREAEAVKVREGRARPDRSANVAAGDLFPKWLEGLTNRNTADDRSRTNRYLIPKWGEVRVRDITLAAILEWLDELRAGTAPIAVVVLDKNGHRNTGRGRRPKAGRISEPTIRHCLNLLSRWFAWCVERGHATHNPVRDIPRQRRPRVSGRNDGAWIDDDRLVRTLFAALPEPFNLMFYIGNRAGLRTGEIAGLRLSDLGFLDDGVIRVRFSYDGPLKEDKAGEGRMKWTPAPADASAVLSPWLARRDAEGAGPEDLAFVAPEGGCYSELAVGRAWNEATRRRPPRSKKRRKAAEGKPAPEPLTLLNWYAATRHSFVTRNLSRGATLDEVSAAVGHSSPTVTRRYYDHYVRRSFSDGLRAGLGLTGASGPGAEVVPLHGTNGTKRRPNPANGTKNGTKREHGRPNAGKKKPAPPTEKRASDPTGT